MKTDTMQKYEDDKGSAVIEVFKDNEGELFRMIITVGSGSLDLDGPQARTVATLLSEVEIE